MLQDSASGACFSIQTTVEIPYLTPQQICRSLFGEKTLVATQDSPMPAQSGSRKQSTQVTSRDARVISTVRLFRQSWQSLIDDMKERMTTTIEPETVFQLLEQSPILEYIASLSTVYPQFTDTERRVLALQRLQLHHNEVLEFLRGCDIDAQEFLDELASKLQGLGAPDPDNVDTMI